MCTTPAVSALTPLCISGWKSTVLRTADRRVAGRRPPSSWWPSRSRCTPTERRAAAPLPWSLEGPAGPAEMWRDCVAEPAADPASGPGLPRRDTQRGNGVPNCFELTVASAFVEF